MRDVAVGPHPARADDAAGDAPMPTEKRVLAVGLGSYAFGRERRAMRTFVGMKSVHPAFLISRWGDGSVGRLLEEHGFDYETGAFGYLGRARPWWTAVTLAHAPGLHRRIVRTYRDRGCRGVVLFDIQTLRNAPLAFLWLRYRFAADFVFYLGDIPYDTWANRMLARLTNRLARRVITNSEAVRASLIRIGVDPGRTDVVYNGVATMDFARPAPDPALVRDDGRLVVAFIGQIREQKGVRDFLEGAALARERADRFRFVLVGPTELDPDFTEEMRSWVREQGLGDRVEFVGRKADMPGVYAAIDIVVAPSRHEEPLANVVIEAMAAGRAVIGTRSGGIPEMIDDGRTGVLVDKKRPDQIANALTALAADPELRTRLGSAAREEARRRFDLVENIRRVEEVILAT